ncbi:hypothetical protein C900_04025 [Fulvivirga imtechensis AK7]|uniref:Secretion system C-terminal sorting domain-containing protein n=2 Tax=Fulvivirga TaxID=396811 RepID=L8JNE3_9BACT|nr:hypothetical protein C900_04025 [Fulvivirga imtechensis AK7]
MVMCYTHAQNFEIVEHSGTYKGHIGEQISAPIKIKNLSDKPLQIIVKRIDKVIGTSQENYICWDGECYGADVNQVPLSKRIEPGETSAKFRSVLESGLVAGFSTVKYLIYDRNNPADAIEYEITYTVEDDSAKPTIFTSEDVRINDVYPNPVVDFAIVDYNLLKEDTKAKIVIHNVLGSIIGEYELAYLETKLKIKTENFNPGVYFYTLYIDNDGVMTRKLIVRK